MNYISVFCYFIGHCYFFQFVEVQIKYFERIENIKPIQCEKIETTAIMIFENGDFLYFALQLQPGSYILGHLEAGILKSDTTRQFCGFIWQFLNRQTTSRVTSSIKKRQTSSKPRLTSKRHYVYLRQRHLSYKVMITAKAAFISMLSTLRIIQQTKAYERPTPAFCVSGLSSCNVLSLMLFNFILHIVSAQS